MQKREPCALQLQRLTPEEAPPKRLRPLATSPTICGKNTAVVEPGSHSPTPRSFADAHDTFTALPTKQIPGELSTDPLTLTAF